jgi:GrpB-like predicted nucleotidyltransferase (UPF0157 family)
VQGPIERRRETMVTDSAEGLQQAIMEPVVLAPPNPAWPEMFADERQRLLDALPGRFIAIEHFGSTAVPGLLAKPVIDMLAGLATIDEAESLIDPLIALGYHYPAAFNASLPDRRWLMRQHLGRRTHHLHLVKYGDDGWARELRFRDVLRCDPGIAAQYARRKRELAGEHANDRERYTATKGEFIKGVLRRGG